MNGNVYLVTIVKNPLPVEARDQGVLSEVVAGPFSVVALTYNDASFMAGVLKAKELEIFNINQLGIEVHRADGK